ncbi:hypothetical protein V6N13_057137 [Hibiscus sabdariffa]
MPFFLTLALAPTLLSTSEAKSLNVYSEEKLEKEGQVKNIRSPTPAAYEFAEVQASAVRSGAGIEKVPEGAGFDALSSSRFEL